MTECNRQVKMWFMTFSVARNFLVDNIFFFELFSDYWCMLAVVCLFMHNNFFLFILLWFSSFVVPMTLVRLPLCHEQNTKCFTLSLHWNDIILSVVIAVSCVLWCERLMCLQNAHGSLSISLDVRIKWFYDLFDNWGISWMFHSVFLVFPLLHHAHKI